MEIAQTCIKLDMTNNVYELFKYISFQFLIIFDTY